MLLIPGLIAVLLTAHLAAVVVQKHTQMPAHGRRDVDKLGVMTLPDQLGTPASFDYAGFNGRGLGDDVMDVLLSLATNSALGDGVAPDPARIGGEFPYFRAA